MSKHGKGKKPKTKKASATASPSNAWDDLTYEETVAKLNALEQDANVGREHKADLEVAYQRGLHWREAVAKRPITSDEGVSCGWLSSSRIVNASTDAKDAKRRELHFGGKPFAHIGETPDGQWVYRQDR